jgi:glycosyltransferase involved in cell wall biosynthesis
VSAATFRVALCFGTYPPTRNGGSDFVERLAVSLVSRGLEVHVLTSGSRHGCKLERCVHVHRVVPDWTFSRTGLRRVDAVLRDVGADAIHVLFPDSVLQGQYQLPALLRLGRVPVVVTWWNLGLGRRSPAAVRLESLALLARSAVLTSHEPVSLRLLRKVALGRPVEWLPAGNNLAFDGGAPAREQLRTELDLDPAAEWLGYFGQLDPTRGVEDLFAAVVALRHSRDVRLVMIGSAGRPERYREDLAAGAYLMTILGLPERLGIADAVVWTDYLSDQGVLGHLRAIDLCVLPYRRNHIGRSALAAALEAGTPIVLAGTPAAIEPLHAGRNVALVPPGAPRALAATIEGLLDDDLARGRLVEGALAAAPLFSWPSIAARAESIYRRACG